MERVLSHAGLVCLRFPEEYSSGEGKERAKAPIDRKNLIGQLAELEKQCFTVPWSEQSFEAIFEREDLTQAIILLKEEKIIGYGIMWVLFERAEILNIAVEKDYRRKGIGGRLLKELLDRAALMQAETVELEVRESNLAARRLYENAGFAVMGSRKNYYRLPTEDAVLMEKSLRGRGQEV